MYFMLTEPNPPQSLALVIGKNSTSTVTFEWQAPNQTASVDKYSYIVLGENTSEKVQNNASSMKVTVQNLTPGATYSISVTAIKNDATSDANVLNLNQSWSHPF